MRSFRADKMGSFIRMLVSEAISNKINDPRVSRFASVTRVEVSGDLQIAKVYVSVMGTPADERKTLAGLRHARGHVQRWVGRQLTVRNVPEIRFVLDESIKGAAETVRQIDDAMHEQGDASTRQPPPPARADGPGDRHDEPNSASDGAPA
ncbi:MAG: 30S ribosome-binding factor RbfA [Phycisphaerales bacterium]|nr:MAG: 30S ribosome-binding factor RbfA [Phycisphaerales bacterium]